MRVRKVRRSALCSRRDSAGFLALKERRSQLSRNNSTNNKDEFNFFNYYGTPVARFLLSAEREDRDHERGKERGILIKNATILVEN